MTTRRGWFIRIGWRNTAVPSAPSSSASSAYSTKCRRKTLVIPACGDARTNFSSNMHGPGLRNSARGSARGPIGAASSNAWKCLWRPSRQKSSPFSKEAPIRHIRDVSQFCDFNGVVDALPHLDRLTGLEFWGLYAFDDSLLKKILASAHLSNLRTLILHHDRNGNLADEDMLVEAIHLPFRANMEELAVNVDGMWRGPSREILKAIATSPYMNRLRKLNLSNAGDEGNQPEMDLETARTLGRSPNLVGLEELDLGQTSFPIEVWDEVLKWPFLPRLKWLRLHYARQVNTPSVMTVAEIRDLRAYRRAFEQTVANVDWTTEFADPWSSNRYWTGFSWDGLRR